MILSISCFYNYGRIVRCSAAFLAGSVLFLAALLMDADLAAAQGEPLLQKNARIVLFPVENLSGMPAPLRELTAELHEMLLQKGIDLVDPAAVETFIDKNRLRYLGGVDRNIAALLRRELKADAVLIVTLELYLEVFPPKISMISRLVSLGEVPEIVWMNSIGMSGDDSPGFLGLGIIESMEELRRKGEQSLIYALQDFVENPPVRPNRVAARTLREAQEFTITDLIRGIEKNTWLPPVQQESRSEYVSASQPDLKQLRITNGGPDIPRYRPFVWYSSRDPLIEQERSMALVPFTNRSTRKHGGELQLLHVARQIVNDGNFRLLELGEVREKMLNMHVVMNTGVSHPHIDLLAIALNVDLLTGGVVFDYLDTSGLGTFPKNAFSLQMFDRDTRKILWSSHSYNQGNDGVWFFEYGIINTAGLLSDRMSRAAIGILVENAGGK